jgi:ribose transport system substrate-binding protein
MKSLANEFFLTMEDGAKAYQKGHSDDFDLISNGIKDETDTAGQTRIVEQMILAKVNALVIAPPIPRPWCRSSRKPSMPASP